MARQTKKQPNEKRAAAKRKRKPTVRNFSARLWTVPMCASWSGLAHKFLLDRIHAGVLEAIAMGPERDHKRRDGSIRHRSCAKYLVVAAPFQKYVRGLSAQGRLLRSA
jgi:hypothetical protein